MTRSWDAEYHARPSFTEILDLLRSQDEEHGFDDAKLKELQDDFKQSMASSPDLNNNNHFSY